MDLLHHPAFQSLVLPLLLALLLAGAGRSLAGPPWAAAGAPLALLVALSLLPGWAFPPPSTLQRLPWIVAAGLLLGAVLQARGGGWRVPAALAWVLVSVWLGAAAGLGGAVVVGVGLLVLLGLADRGPARAASPQAGRAGGAEGLAMIAVSALGLAVVGATGGSLLLAQLALMLSAAAAGAGLWAWPRRRIEVGVVALLPLGLGALALLQAAWQLGILRPGPALLLALAFAAAPLLARSPVAAREWLAPLLVAAMAALPVGAAVGWQLAAASAPATGADPDDPYYEPRKP